jgi:hypothetical protein
MVNLSQKKNISGFGCVAVPPPPRTCCRPKWGVWGGWGTAAQPQPPWNSLWSNLIWDNELDGRMGLALVGCLGFAMAFH